MSLISNTNGSAKSPEAEISPENYSFLQGRIYRDSGIVLDETKRYLIESRLLPIVRKENLRTLDELCSRLRIPESIVLRQQVVEAMTTNETLFFRDAAMFESLQNHLFPALVDARKASRTLRIWSAAASSGQEAYSLAILLSEMGLAGWNIRILGTDLNTRILDQAKTGRYTQLEVNRGLPAKYLVKYFDKVGLGWQLQDRVRQMVEFQQFDLRQSMRSLGPFDLVLCRNVLIYFDVDTKKQILGQIYKLLNPKALVALGSAETTINLDSRFASRVIGRSVFFEAQ